MTKLITTKMKSFLGSQIEEAIEEFSNTSFYLYAGVHGDVIGDIPIPADDDRDVTIDAYRNMIFGKRVAFTDLASVIRYVPWVTNKVFAMYNDNDEDLLTKDFFCQVQEGSFYHVYKCLDNNFNANSTSEPLYSFVNQSSNYIFQTSDGYVWKYMFTVTESVADKFKTQNYFPAYTNTEVASAATKGAIDVIRIEQSDLEIPGGGKKYDNYVTGTWVTGELRLSGNNFLYEISNDTISFTTGFYTGCLIYVSGGVGVGQYKTITDYFHNSNGNFIVIDSAFTVPPMNGSTWEIYPEVRITGSGTQTVNAVARALVNSTGSNSVYKIEMLEKGANYDFILAEIVANGVITTDTAFRPAELHPIYSPQLGHGVNAPEELGSTAIEFSVKFSNTESNTIPTENRYQQIGLLINPAFANVIVQTTNTAGSFLVGEDIFKLKPVRMNTNVYISNTSATITGQSSQLSNASIVTTGDLGSYIPGDVLDIEGGVSTQVAQVLVDSTEVRTAVINNAGSGYTPGSFSANLNLGTAVTNATFTVTVNSTGFCDSVIIDNPGVFTANPPFLSNSTPVGGSPGTGLTLKIEMGLDDISIFEPGSYAVIPTDLATNEPIANTSNGSGAELLISFTQTLGADFIDQLDAGDYIYISNIEKTLQQLAVVNSIINATALTITVNGFFSCTMANMYLPHLTANAEVVETANSSTVGLDEVDQELGTGDLIVGLSSGAKAQVNTITRNGVTKNFDTFVQLYKYDILVLSGSFIENEIIFQGASLEEASATALLHSVVADGGITYLYTSNQVGTFTTTDLLRGANSLAIADVNSSWSPELVFASGDVLYIENLEPVNRSTSQAETFQVIFEF